MITFSEAIDKYLISPCDGEDDVDIVEKVRAFIKLFEDGALLARGFKIETFQFEEIPKDFWRTMRCQFNLYTCRIDFKWTGGDRTNSIWRDGNFADKIYESIEVSEQFHEVVCFENATQVKKNKGGRKPSASWYIVSTIACRAIHEYGYPDNQMELVRYIESEIDRLNCSEAVGRESLIKLVRTICHHRS